MANVAVKRTPAQQKLYSLSQKEGQATIARKIGAAQQSVSRWGSGASRPSPFWRKVIARKLRIAERDWLTEEERELIGAAA